MAINIPNKKQSSGIWGPLLTLAGGAAGAYFGKGVAGAGLGASLGGAAGQAIESQTASGSPAPAPLATNAASPIQRKLQSSVDNESLALAEGLQASKHLPEDQRMDAANQIYMAMLHKKYGGQV